MTGRGVPLDAGMASCVPPADGTAVGRLASSAINAVRSGATGWPGGSGVTPGLAAASRATVDPGFVSSAVPSGSAVRGATDGPLRATVPSMATSRVPGSADSWRTIVPSGPSVRGSGGAGSPRSLANSWRSKARVGPSAGALSSGESDTRQPYAILTLPWPDGGGFNESSSVLAADAARARGRARSTLGHARMGRGPPLHSSISSFLDTEDRSRALEAPPWSWLDLQLCAPTRNTRSKMDFDCGDLCRRFFSPRTCVEPPEPGSVRLDTTRLWAATMRSR